MLERKEKKFKCDPSPFQMITIEKRDLMDYPVKNEILYKQSFFGVVEIATLVLSLFI